VAAAGAEPRPLDGIRVVDLSRYLPGPLVTRLLADMGARVIKVEEPRLGDPVRHDPQGKEGRSALAAMLLAGHESLALDLKRPAARECLEDLLLAADVLVESFRPGTLARFGLAPADLRRRYPRLVICSVTGWGQEGPHAHRAGHDLGYQALAGALAGSPHMPATQTADVVGAWSAAAAVLAALLRRHRTGRGAWIDQALLDAAGHAAVTGWAAEAAVPREVGEPLLLTGAVPCYDLYRTRDDGWLAVAALEPRFWQKLCRALGRKDLIFKQYARDAGVRRQVAALMAERTRAEWAQFMAEHDVPAEPVLSLSEALAHPQVRHRELVRPGEDELPRLGYPALIDGERPRGGARFPELGEHTEALVREFGLARQLSRGRRRFAGIGRRFSVKRWLLRFAGRVVDASQRR
jgi:crotonobetainyl-CoA:carnitine CoA-transferase CaiB-like acyl-CoA transferase